MHAYAITRGVKMWVDNYITQLQGKYFPFEVKKGAAGLPKGKAMLQMQVRPVQLWEFVFPKEQKDIALATIFGKDGITQHKKHRKYIKWLAKILGIKPFPKYDNTKAHMVDRSNVEVIGVGIKEDYNFEDGTEAL